MKTKNGWIGWRSNKRTTWIKADKITAVTTTDSSECCNVITNNDGDWSNSWQITATPEEVMKLVDLTINGPDSVDLTGIADQQKEKLINVTETYSKEPLKLEVPANSKGEPDTDRHDPEDSDVPPEEEHLKTVKDMMVTMGEANALYEKDRRNNPGISWYTRTVLYEHGMKTLSECDKHGGRGDEKRKAVDEVRGLPESKLKEAAPRLVGK